MLRHDPLIEKKTRDERPRGSPFSKAQVVL